MPSPQGFHLDPTLEGNGGKMMLTAKRRSIYLSSF